MIPGGGGLIVFVGFSPLRGIPGFAHASAGRAAVANLASGLALEWSRHRIRSVCVAPGTILTEALEDYGEEALADWERAIPLGRLGRPGGGGEPDRLSRLGGRRLRDRDDDRGRRRRRRLGHRAAAAARGGGRSRERSWPSRAAT